MIQTKHPIVIIGAGGIVNTAHLPAYRIAGFDVQGIYDINPARARATAEAFGIEKVYDNMQQAIREAPEEVVFDVAVPGNALTGILPQLPDGAAVLMQKPMGETLGQAKEILQLCRDKRLLGAVNFQLRFAPAVKAAREMIGEGWLGDFCDMEIYVNTYTPWHLWDFLFSSPRVEILYHSIHYIDLVRSFLGNPSGVYAKTIGHPLMKELSSVRSNIIMDYGPRIRVNISTNHAHHFGPHNQQAYIKWEGTKGAIKATLGNLLNYPAGVPDTFEYTFPAAEGATGWADGGRGRPPGEHRTPWPAAEGAAGWADGGNGPSQPPAGQPTPWFTQVMEQTWFPHAFTGSMEEVMKAMDGLIERPSNSVEDSIYTMACVEAAYESSEQGGIDPLKYKI